MKTDIVLGLAWGDEAKAKVTHSLLQSENYTHCVRFSGGANAGHTIIHKGNKIVTHLIPAGVFLNVPSIIGPGCVVNVKGFFEELEYLSKNNVDTTGLIKIATNVHIVTEEHLEEDGKDTKIGTTRKGIGPAYRDKYARTGKRAEDIPELKDYLVDFWEETLDKPDSYILLEGAQGFWLDINFGEYPYVTSGHSTTAGALLCGIPHTSLKNIYGACKAYDTYVGAKSFQPEGDIFKKIQEVGQEFGATTGRARQCNFLNLDALYRAAQVNGVTRIVVNKMDILEKLDCWKIYSNKDLIDLKTKENFIQYIEKTMPKSIEGFRYSYSPNGI